MQSSLKKSLYLGLAALSFAGVAAVSTTASAKSYATAGAYTTLKSDAATRNVEATGTNALYTKPGTVKGAKVVASKATMAKLASSKKSADYFRAYGVKTTNRGSVYYRVVSMDGKYRGYIYGGKSDTAFAGGIKSANTTTAATAPSKTQSYYLKSAGTTNTLWTAPKYTQYKASKVVNSTEAFANDAFTVDQAATKTREGSLYYHVTDQTNPKISGWIYAGALQTTPSDSAVAAKGLTVNYVDQSTGKTVKSGVVLSTDKDLTANPAVEGKTVSTAQADDFNAQIVKATPAGYTLTNSTTTSGTTTTSVVTAATKFGSSLTLTVTANPAQSLNVAYGYMDASNAFTAFTTTGALASDAKTTLSDAQTTFTTDNKAPEGSVVSTTDLSAALTSAKLDTIYVPTTADATKYTKYTVNTSLLPTAAAFGASTASNIYYTAADGTYSLSGSTMTQN
ncbi:S-layer protein [Levilactobacillus brevis]|uniref:S-layer protein n=1 Tax=Levilactobacillus brevis TaxID=1580 RepID=UPI00264A4ADE|nr:S-layer protein [Levilactobacillus brevis]